MRIPIHAPLLIGPSRGTDDVVQVCFKREPCKLKHRENTIDINEISVGQTSGVRWSGNVGAFAAANKACVKVPLWSVWLQRWYRGSLVLTLERKKTYG